jgi:hypothetical protein
MDKNLIFLLLLPPPSLPIGPARSQPRPSTHPCPSPLQRDVGWLDLSRLGGMAGRTQGGTQQVGGPVGMSRKCRGPFSLIPLSLIPIKPHTMPIACVATTTTTSQGSPELSDPHDDTTSPTPAYNEAELQTTWQRAQQGRGPHDDMPGPIATSTAQRQCVEPNDDAYSTTATSRIERRRIEPNCDQWGPTTTRRARLRQVGSKNNALSPTVTHTAERRHEGPNHDTTRTMGQSRLALPHFLICIMYLSRQTPKEEFLLGCNKFIYYSYV